MKSNIKNILNEARVLRTIDSKIWASMSSMTSRLRSTLGLDAKPMKKDDLNTLLQKYVAGLLTMKVLCPNNVSEIDDIKAYRQIGMAYINAGGTISEIQRLFAENGGELSQGLVSSAKPNDLHMDDEMEEFDKDSAAYDEVESDNISDEFDTVAEPDPVTDIQNNPGPKHDFDAAVNSNNKVTSTDNADVERKIVELSQTQKYINTYLKKNRAILAAEKGEVLAFNNNLGLFEVLKDHDENQILPISSGRGFSNIDKKTRFFVVGNTAYELGNAGNNGVYDDYYFRKKESFGGILQIIPGSNYYEDEITKGKFYTKILADNGNIPAMHVLDAINECSIDNPDALEILKVSAYLPTLPELASVQDLLPSGVYWTSSVAQDGSSNVALAVKPGKVLINCKSANVVTFIRFS